MSEPVLHFKLYSQDGKLIDMTCADTPANRKFTEWVRRFDRYTTHGDEDE